jgi:hypothetical protein
MVTQHKGSAYRLEYQVTGDTAAAQAQVMAAVYSATDKNGVQTTRKALPVEGANAINIKLISQLSFPAHASKVQLALGSGSCITIVTPTAESWIDPQGPIFTSTDNAQSTAPAAAAAAAQACTTMVLATPASTSSAQYRVASDERERLVQQHSGQQGWEGFIVRIGYQPHSFGRVNGGKVEHIAWVNNTTKEVRYDGERRPNTLNEIGWEGDHDYFAIENPLWSEFPDTTVHCQRLRQALSAHMFKTEVAVVMEERRLHPVPRFYLYVKSTKATHKTLKNFMEDLGKLLRTGACHVRYFNLKVPPTPPADKLHDLHGQGCAIVTRDHLHTPWPLQTDFTVPAGVFDGGSSSANTALTAHFTQRAVPYIMEAYCSSNHEQLALALCDIAPADPAQACRALEAAIADAGGETAALARCTGAPLIEHRHALEQQHKKRKAEVAELDLSMRALAALERQSKDVAERRSELSKQRDSDLFDISKVERGWLQKFEAVQHEYEMLKVESGAHLDKLKSAAFGCDAASKEARERLLSDMQAAHKVITRLVKELSANEDVLIDLQAQRKEELESSMDLEVKRLRLESSLMEQFQVLQQHARQVGYKLTISKL